MLRLTSPASRCTLILATLALFFATTACPTHAQTPAVDVVEELGFLLGIGSSIVVGWDFTADEDLCVDALGYYSFFDFRAADHEVGIYSGTGSLLASGTVSTAATAEGSFAWVSIPEICLDAGETYTIAGVAPAPLGVDFILVDPLLRAHPSITITGGRYLSEIPPVLQYPDPSATQYLGPTFRIASDCLSGTVNDSAGTVEDVLFVNGGGGWSDSRGMTVTAGELVWASLLTPPGGSNGKFVMHANAGFPTSGIGTALPASIGSTCFPLLLPGGATPVAIWNNIGKTAQVGSSEDFGASIPNPDRTPSIFLEESNGDLTNLPPGTEITLQGVVVDAATTSPKGASTTNAVLLTVE